MPRFDWVSESARPASVRAKQLAGMFDLPVELKLRREWSLNLPIEQLNWNIGLIVGPSGSGKSSLLRQFGYAEPSREWGSSCILDDFPSTMSIKDIVALLSAVGLSSPPDWLKPYAVLSNGERFRVALARELAETSDNGITLIDEFTSVVDRVVARTASCAFAKAIRARNQRCIVASCHYDIIDWLAPDWVIEPHTAQFEERDCLQRPPITLEFCRVHYSAWKHFAAHHYLSSALNRSARCFVAFWDGVPVAFTSALPFVGRHKGTRRLWREHRTVCLPDYQGASIGTRVSALMGSIVTALGGRWTSTTSHPAMIAARKASREWKMTRAPSFTNAHDTHSAYVSKRSGGQGRLTASFEYVGAPYADVALARRVFDGT